MMPADRYSPPVLLDRQQRVRLNAPCLGCGYNLRTQPVGGLCPECARPVALSVSGQLLRFAEPQWVRRLARGALLLVVALAGAAALAVLIPLATVVVAGLAAPGAPAVGPGLVAAAMLAELLAAAALLVLTIAGLWLLASPETAGGRREAGPSARRTLRACACLLPLSFVLGLLALAGPAGRMAFGSPGPAPGPELPAVALANLLLAAPLLLVTVLAALRHLAGLMRRVPRPGLAVLAHFEFWAGLPAGVLLAASYGYLLLTYVIPLWQSAASWPATASLTSASGAAGRRTATMPGRATTYHTYRCGVAPTGPFVQAATTMPATLPAGGPPAATSAARLARIGPALFIAAATSGLGGCAVLALGVAAFLLLVLAWRALGQAAREAAENATLARAPPPRAANAPA